MHASISLSFSDYGASGLRPLQYPPPPCHWLALRHSVCVHPEMPSPTRHHSPHALHLFSAVCVCLQLVLEECTHMEKLTLCSGRMQGMSLGTCPSLDSFTIDCPAMQQVLSGCSAAAAHVPAVCICVGNALSLGRTLYPAAAGPAWLQPTARPAPHLPCAALDRCQLLSQAWVGGLGGVGRVDGQVCSTRSHMSFRLHMSFRSHMSFPLRTHLLTILRCRPSLLAEMALLRPWPAALSWRSLIWEPVTRVGGQNSISAYLHCANAYLTALAWTQLLRDDWRCLLHALCIIAWLQSLSTA